MFRWRTVAIAFAFLFATAAATVAQNAGDIWASKSYHVTVDSVAGGKVFGRVSSSSDSSIVGLQFDVAQLVFNQLFTLVTPAGDPVAGQTVFLNSCSGCHAFRQGVDLRHFNYARQKVVDRASLHVSAVDAQNVASYVQSILLPVDTMTPLKRPFQPGGVVLASDVDFALDLFGVDAWPAGLTRDSLRNINPLNVKIPLPLPEWSNEILPYDWLPGAGGVGGELPAGVLAASQSYIDAYYANPTVATAMLAAGRIRSKAHDEAIADAPCMYESQATLPRYDAVACAYVGDWIASFLYTAAVVAGDLHGWAPTITKEWWETGHLYHKGQQNQRPIPMRDENIAGWMHLGWMWDYSLLKNTSYEVYPLKNLGFTRLGTFVALRTMVERGAVGNFNQQMILMCADALNTADAGYVGWTYEAMTFAYNEILYRDSVTNITGTAVTTCISYINTAQVKVNNRAGTAVKNALQPLANQAIAALQN